jgi:anti-sigma regulatory factor (Ser/Thr protein kinase)
VQRSTTPNGHARGRWRATRHELHAMRTALRVWLAELALTADAERNLVIAANEAATNAVEHAYRPTTAQSADDNTFEVTLSAESGWLCVEITDRGSWREPADAGTGRGLGIPLMHHLVPSVTIDREVHGTRVVLRHPFSEPAPPLVLLR